MKTTIHTPTGDYAYVETERDGEFLTMDVIEHNNLVAIVKGQEGLDDKEWRRVVDKMLLESECNPDDIAMMNPQQQWYINETKKAFKRIKSRE